MTVRLRFYRGEHGTTDFEPGDDSWSALGSFLTGDVQSSAWALLGVLADVEAVLAGQAGPVPLSGNGWEGSIDRAGLHLQDRSDDDWTGEHGLDDAHEAMLRYWDHLSPTVAGKLADLGEWESGNGRTHPCRRHLALG